MRDYSNQLLIKVCGNFNGQKRNGGDEGLVAELGGGLCCWGGQSWVRKISAETERYLEGQHHLGGNGPTNPSMKWK
jgi:hypothetical protein